MNCRARLRLSPPPMGPGASVDSGRRARDRGRVDRLSRRRCAARSGGARLGRRDLVVGPKGSALDLVLCCVLHVSDPTGLVSEKAAMAAVKHPLVRVAAPIALGDNVEGWRIVGTTPDFLVRLSRGHRTRPRLEQAAGSRTRRPRGAGVEIQIGRQLCGRAWSGRRRRNAFAVSLSRRGRARADGLGP